MDPNKEKAEFVEKSFTEIFDIEGGTQPPKSEFIYEPKNGYIRLLQIRDFGANPVPTYIPLNKKLKLCNINDILIGRYGASVGRICTGMEGAYNVALAKVIPLKKMNDRYIYHLLNSNYFQTQLKRIERSAQNGFNKDDLAEIDLPHIEDYDKQTTISKQLDLFTDEIKIAKLKIHNAKFLIKRFKLAILTAAVTGKLTENWRIINNLKEISDSNKDFFLKSGIYLPNQWRVSTFDDVSDDITVGYVSSMTHEYRENGIPFLRSLNIKEFSLDFDNLKYVSKDFHIKNKKSSLKPGDLVIVRTGNAGTACVIPESLVEANCSDLVIVRLSNRINNNFACIYMNSPLMKGHVIGNMVGIAQGHFNISAMRKTPVPLPSLEEQEEITKKVKYYFDIAYRIEHQIEKAEVKVSKLTQAILAKTFQQEA